jgi:hypothetical protein
VVCCSISQPVIHSSQPAIKSWNGNSCLNTEVDFLSFPPIYLPANASQWVVPCPLTSPLFTTILEEIVCPLFKDFCAFFGTQMSTLVGTGPRLLTLPSFVLNTFTGIWPLTPELNPSAQRCLTRFYTWDLASWTVYFVKIYARKTNKSTNYSFSLLILYGNYYMFRYYINILRERS